MKKMLPIYGILLLSYVGINLVVILFTTMILNQQESLLDPSVSFSHRAILIGTIISLYPFGQLIGVPILSHLSNQFGRKKVLLYSLFFSSVFYLGIGFGITFSSIFLAISSLFLLGLTEGNSVIAQHIISEEPAEKREKIRQKGIIPMLISISWILAPLLVAHFYNINFNYYLNFSLPFYALSVVVILLFFYTLFFFECESDENEIQQSEILKLEKKLHLKNLLSVFVGNFFLFLTYAGVLRLYPVFLVEKFGLNTFTLSRAVAFNGIGILVVHSFFYSKLKKIKSSVLLRNFSFLSALLVMITAFQKNLALTIFFMFFAVVCIAISLIASLDLISKKVPQEALAEIFGKNSRINYISQVIVGLLGTLLMVYDKTGLLIQTALFSLIASYIFFKILNRSSAQH